MIQFCHVQIKSLLQEQKIWSPPWLTFFIICVSMDWPLNLIIISSKAWNEPRMKMSSFDFILMWWTTGHILKYQTVSQLSVVSYSSLCSSSTIFVSLLDTLGSQSRWTLSICNLISSSSSPSSSWTSFSKSSLVAWLHWKFLHQNSNLSQVIAWDGMVSNENLWTSNLVLMAIRRFQHNIILPKSEEYQRELLP